MFSISGLNLKSLYFLLGAILSCAVFSFDSLASNTQIRLTNRAQCAEDSHSPSDTVFLILDTYNAQKLAHNYAASQKLDSKIWVEKAALEYRMSMTHNTLTVMNKILLGQLPLLPVNLKNPRLPLQQYQKIVSSCKSLLRCPELDNYFQKIWKAADVTDEVSRKTMIEIDQFTDGHFITQTRSVGRYQTVSVTNRIECSLLKKFSPLQINLGSNLAGKTEIEQIAKAYLNRNNYIASCYSQGEDINNDYAALQIDIMMDSALWKSIGFDFWNSVRIYSSWTWRKTDLVTPMSRTYNRLFKSIALEESMMIIPNGCQSVTPQECNEKNLSENAIREFAKVDSNLKEYTSSLPAGPEKLLISQKPPPVNTDILKIFGTESSNDWIEKFRDKFIRARGVSHARVQTFLQTLNVLSTNFKVETAEKGFQTLLKLAESGNQNAKTDLYYSCQELRTAFDLTLNQYRKQIELAFRSPQLQRMNQNNDRVLLVLWNYVEQVANKVLPVCDQANEKRLATVPHADFSSKKLRPWFQEYVYDKRATNEIDDPGLKKSVLRNEPLFLWNRSQGIIQGNVLCYDESDCVRLVVESSMELAAASKYASAFVNEENGLQSASLFNPYAELTACSIYDPWLMSRQAYKGLFKDIVNTALFGWNFLPIYVDATQPLPKVSSFQTLIEDGVVKFDPKIEKQRSLLTLYADLGPLLGAPCQLSFSETGKDMVLAPYYISGVSVVACDGSKEKSIEVRSGEIENGENKSISKCFSCSIYFESALAQATNKLSTSFAPLKLGISIFKTISNFVSAKADQVNIPIEHTINPVYAAEIYHRHGSIPEMCIEQLTRGLQCFENVCAARAAKAFEQATGEQVTSAYIGHEAHGETQTRNHTYAYLSGKFCEKESTEEIRIPVVCTGDGLNEKNFSINLKQMSSFDRGCHKDIQQFKERL
jgi:hypothetical protein